MQYRRDKSTKKITPPGSFVKVPLTPPPSDGKPTKRVLKILHLIRQYKEGRPASKSEWQTYNLQRKEYDQLLGCVGNEASLWAFVESKLRYDYNSSAEVLTLRMPGQLHEVFLARVVEEIQDKLRSFTETEGRVGAFAKKIKHNGSGRLNLCAEEENNAAAIRREPDAIFKHCDAQWPGVVIEVSHSQKSKALPHLADDYILETNGSIRVVIGLDIDYKTKQGTLSMWRPDYVTTEPGQLELEANETLNHQIFRYKSGNPNLSRNAGLHLALRDFAPEDLAGGISGSFLIDAATLCRFLDEAEKEERFAEQGGRLVQALRSGAKKRRRQKTPPEEITSEDDRKLGDEERRVRAKVSDDDSSYKSSQPEMQTDEDNL